MGGRGRGRDGYGGGGYGGNGGGYGKFHIFMMYYMCISQC